MERYWALAIFCCFILLVLARVLQLRKLGIQALRFGRRDKKDFLIPPFALFYFYLLLASAVQWPVPGAELFYARWLSVIGLILCLLGLLLFVYALVSFGRNFRVGLDEESPGQLVTSGAFALSRNPIYVAFALALTGIFLIIPNWLLLVYLGAAVLLFQRQIRLEEQSLHAVYGAEYEAYCRRVRRFL